MDGARSSLVDEAFNAFDRLPEASAAYSPEPCFVGLLAEQSVLPLDWS